MSLRVDCLSAPVLGRVVEVHLRAFPAFFLSRLGGAFLREFYASFLTDPVGVGFVAKSGDGREDLAGAIVGPVDPRGYFGRLVRRRWHAFAWASLGAVLRDPRVAPRLARALTYRGESPSGPPRALLSSIAVDPAAQGKGIGRQLVSAWLEEVRRRGAPGAYLTTDAEGNEATNQFYRRLGWRLESGYVTREGRRMNRYVYDFESCGDAGAVAGKDGEGS